MYAAESPDRATEYFKKNVDEMRDNLKTLKSTLPNLKSMADGEKPSVRFYEGEEAIQILYSDFHRTKPRVLREVTNIQSVEEYMDIQEIKQANSKIKTKSVIRALYYGELSDDKKSNKNFRRMPPGIQKFNGDIWIYSNKIAFLTYIGNTILVIIDNKTFAETMIALFDTAWTLSE